MKPYTSFFSYSFYFHTVVDGEKSQSRATKLSSTPDSGS